MKFTFQNCEHVVNWCIRGEMHSMQVLEPLTLSAVLSLIRSKHPAPCSLLPDHSTDPEAEERPAGAGQGDPTGHLHFAPPLLSSSTDFLVQEQLEAGEGVCLEEVTRSLGSSSPSSHVHADLSDAPPSYRLADGEKEEQRGG